MELTIFSDLHLNKIPEKVDINGDVGVIAGDISENITIVADFLSNLSKNFNYILFTAGNIELWNKNTSSKNPLENINFIQNNTPKNVIVLDTVKYVKIRGKIFAGNIYLQKESVTHNDIDNIIADIDSAEFLKNLSKKKIKSLHSIMKEADPDIIVTHYPPIPITALHKINSVRVEEFKKIWIFGHFHRCKSFFASDPFKKDRIYISNTENSPIKLKIKV